MPHSTVAALALLGLASCGVLAEPALSDPNAWSNRRALPDERHARIHPRVTSPHTKASVVASTRSVSSNMRFHVALLISIEPGYWIPAEAVSGGVDASLRLRSPSGFSAGAQLTPRPHPLREFDDELGYEDLTAWFVEVQAPPGLVAGDRHSFDIAGAWTVCEKRCHIEEYSGVVFVDVAEPASAPGFEEELSTLLQSASRAARAPRE